MLDGLCPQCGKNKSLEGSNYCLPCLKIIRKRSRKIQGSAPWKLGTRGSPPVEFDSSKVISWRIENKIKKLNLSILKHEKWIKKYKYQISKLQEMSP